MIVRGITLLAATVALAGCASQASVAKRDNFDLCRSATIGELVGADKLSRAEALKRGLITESEWPIMVDRRLEAGMSECAALSILRGNANVKGVNGPYRFGADNTVVIYDFDPREPPASATNYWRRRAAETCYTPTTCYTPPVQTVEQKYVPKYRLTFKGGKLAECRSVDFAKIDGDPSRPDLFTLPCMKEVPGFKNG